jgi:hypothetical protein
MSWQPHGYTHVTALLLLGLALWAKWPVLRNTFKEQVCTNQNCLRFRIPALPEVAPVARVCDLVRLYLISCLVFACGPVPRMQLCSVCIRSLRSPLHSALPRQCSAQPASTCTIPHCSNACVQLSSNSADGSNGCEVREERAGTQTCWRAIMTKPPCMLC